MKIRKDFAYIHRDHAIPVGLHWCWSQNAHLFPLRLEELWRSRAAVRLAGRCVAAMPREELVLYLCAHEAHTGWFRLKWVCDIAELLREAGGIDVPRLVTRARDLGSRRMLAQGLLLVHHLLDTPLSPWMAGVMQQERRVSCLVQVATQALLQDERYWTAQAPVATRPAQVRYRLALRASLKYKVYHVYFYSLWTDDWRLVRLPARLFPLYFVLRPFLGLVRRVRKRHTRCQEHRTAR